jgi:RNA polymerase sigma factor (sigma-70 family)
VVSKLVEIPVAGELIASARSGDETARSRLYAALAPATYGLIYRMVGTRAVAEDLFQETLMTVFERLDTFRGEAPLGAWVRQIAVSRCLMYLRSPWHRARLDLGAWWDDGPAAPHAAPAPSAESLDVERALAMLSPTARAIVWLFEVEGYSHQEIAQAFGRTTSFSKSQLARAHRRLREWLEPNGERQPCTPV